MNDRLAPAAVLVAAVVLVGTVAGGLVARALRDDGGDSPTDADVIAAIGTRTSLDTDGAGCVFGRLAASGVLDDDLRRRLVDATDALADVPGLADAATACGASGSTTSTSTAVTVPGPLADCVGGAGADPAVVHVCAVDALVTMLVRDSGLDVPTASCAAEAVVDELGVDAVVAALASGVPPADLRDRLQAAFAAC